MFMCEHTHTHTLSKHKVLFSVGGTIKIQVSNPICHSNERLKMAITDIFIITKHKM